MALIDSIKSYFSTNTNAYNPPILGRKDTFFAALVNQFSGKKNPDINLKTAVENVSTIFSCISILANSVARLPLHIYKDDGKEKKIFKEHPYYNAIRYQPQSYYSYDNFTKLFVTHLYSTGNAYAFINDQYQFEIIHPSLISSVDVVAGELWYYSKDLDRVFNYKKILHWKLISNNGLTGIDPIKALKNELNIQGKATLTVSNYYSNNAHGTKYLESVADGTKTTNAKIAELIQDYKDKYSGYENVGEIQVIPPSFTLKQLNYNPIDLQFLQSTEYSTAAIASAFGISPRFLGKTTDTKFSTAEQGNLEFQNNTLAPLMSLITSELEAKLLTIEERNAGVCIDFDEKELISVSMLEKSQVYKNLQSMGAISPNQIAKEFFLPLIDNPNGDYHFIQSQNVPIELMTAESINKTSTTPPVPASTGNDNNPNEQ